MGIAGFFMWLQRHYTKAILDVKPRKDGGVGGGIPVPIPKDVEAGGGDEAEPTVDEGASGMETPAPTGDSSGGRGGGGDGRACYNCGLTGHMSRECPTAPSGGRGGRGGGRGGRGGRGFFPTPESIDHVPCDNLYLDMNGLIHPCCHDTAPMPEPESEEEMLDRIFKAVDKLVVLVKPKKVLFLAVDGVAPRSKMNQQRARRFRAAAERQEANEIARRMADVVVEAHQLPRPASNDKWDHNVITPATTFMDRVGSALEWYIVKRLNDGDDDWKDLTVVFSDAHVPGEGEHKIMAYVRALRAQPGYNPNTRHVIHGQDADLIMLGLSTHEAHFTVLRNSLCMETFQPLPDAFCLFDLGVFRDLLQRDMASIMEKADFERVVDDFIFLCFLIGNDFLPHMPLVDIKCKGIETVLDHYVRYFDQYGFLTDGAGAIHFEVLQKFLASFASERLHELVRLKDGAHIRVERANDRMVQTVQDNREAISAKLASVGPHDDPTTTEGVAKSILKLYIEIAREQLRLVAGKHPLPFTYGEGNYRDEYYKSRFGWSYTDEKVGLETSGSRALFEEGVRRCVHEYLRGMQWVLWYYTIGCPSWEWFYPYHYAPLLQDVGRYGNGAPIDMTLGEPLHPVEQLIAVLPRESVHALPPELHRDVLDPKSVLAKFYPREMNVDYSEAIHSWQGTTLLPFVNCRRLQKAVREVVSLAHDEGWALVFAREESATAAALEKYLPAAAAPAPEEDGDDAEKKTKKAPVDSAAALVDVPAEVAKVCPLAGKMGPFVHAWPRGIGLRCPDNEFAEAYDGKSDVATPVTSNAVVTYQYTVPALIGYMCSQLEGARRERAAIGHGQAGVKRPFAGRGSGGDSGGRGGRGGGRGGGGGNYHNQHSQHNQHHGGHGSHGSHGGHVGHRSEQSHYHGGDRGGGQHHDRHDRGHGGGGGGQHHHQQQRGLPPPPPVHNHRGGGGGRDAHRNVAPPPPPPPRAATGVVRGGRGAYNGPTAVPPPIPSNAAHPPQRSASGQPAARRGPRAEGRK